MKLIEWSKEKNELLKKNRKVCFEDAVKEIKENKIIDTLKHPNKEKYHNQGMFILRIKNYIYCVPYVQDEEKIFLKTIYPSRKFKKIYSKKDSYD